MPLAPLKSENKIQGGEVFPGSFDYHRPQSVDEAVALLGQYGDDGKVLAGGHSLIPMMKLRLAQPEHLIDITRIAELKGIEERNGVLHIGAMVSENEIIASELLWEKCPLIPETARLIADPQCRNRGTIGGDVVHGDPANDQPAVMLALGASLVLRGSSGERVVPAQGFYLGLFDTAMAADEMLTEIRVPVPPSGTGHSYQKLKRKVGDYATAAAAVLITLDGESCSHAAVALTNLGPTPIKVAAAENLLTGKVIDDAAIEEAGQLAASASDPSADLHGPVEYKKRMAGEMTKRAIREALGRARGG